MSASQQFLICDQSTYANFFQWASAISAFFAACGWTQTTDTGQEIWTGMNVTAVSMSGTTATITYNSLTGLPLASGRALTFTGLTNSGNNKTLVITSFTGTTSGTITCTNASGVTESGSSGVVTAATTVPGSAAFVYEVWQPGDGLTAFFVKMEYGNVSGTNSPSVRLTISTSMNGSGTPTGLMLGPWFVPNSAITPPSTTAAYPCYFSGDSGRMGIMLWPVTPNSTGIFFAIERSLNSSGAATGSYVTLWTACSHSGNGVSGSSQGTILFGVGVAPNGGINQSNFGGWVVRIQNLNGATSVFNNAVPFDTCTPVIGKYDYPCTVAGVGSQLDFSESVPFQVTLYGSVRTYMPSKSSNFQNSNPNNASNVSALCMRYD